MKIKTYQPILEENEGPICTNPNTALYDIVLTLEDNAGMHMDEDVREVFCMLMTDGLDITRLPEGDYDFLGAHKLRIAIKDKAYVDGLPEFSGY
ncbi:hypothetical protein [Paenibacillus sp. VTT E-133291]|uniref:hypothetical protein n=1 Tax=Paenibacillus sp. VTT E-133291 TaxID=1986223 RepID=UPI000BA00ED5|nr:hypothetical protein [Paenibacillus sp. VTT E-133291]OZQ97345.1 hypothetical protein CA598_06010 [Paenibacillus sp. VTT E-133291]